MTVSDRPCGSVLPAIGLVATLYLMYSPAFLTDYLMGDEWAVIGWRGNLRRDAIDGFFYWGRALFGIYSTLVYRFVRYDPLRIQLVRFLNFAGFAAIAVVLFIFLKRRTQSPLFSYLVVVFLLSQPPFQAAMGFSLQLISNTQPAMWLSLLAFYIYFSLVPGKHFSSILSTNSCRATSFIGDAIDADLCFFLHGAIDLSCVERVEEQAAANRGISGVGNPRIHCFESHISSRAVLFAHPWLAWLCPG